MLIDSIFLKKKHGNKCETEHEYTYEYDANVRMNLNFDCKNVFDCEYA